MPPRIPFEPGQQFGRLTVLEDLGSRNGSSWSLLRCECGEKREVRNTCLREGKSKSCGCLKRELCSQRMKDLNSILWNDPSFRELKSRQNKAQWTEQARQAQSERMKALHQDPEYRKFMSEVAKKSLETLRQDPKFREKQRKATIALHQDPKFEEKRLRAAFRALSRNPSWPECRLYGLIQGTLVTSTGFVAQQLITSGGIPDGMYPKEKIVMELDGGGHHVFGDRTEQDMVKDKTREKDGWLVLREEDESVLFLKTLAILSDRR